MGGALIRALAFGGLFLLAAGSAAQQSPSPVPDAAHPVNVILVPSPQPDFSPRALANKTELTEPELRAMRLEPGAPDNVRRGYELYELHCLTCHGIGYEQGGTQTLAARYKGERPAVLALRTDMNAAFIRALIRTASPGMPPFRKTELSDAGLNDIIAYLTRNNGEGGEAADHPNFPNAEERQ